MITETVNLLTAKNLSTYLESSAGINCLLTNRKYQEKTNNIGPVIYISDQEEDNKLVLIISNNSDSDILLQKIDLTKVDPSNPQSPILIEICDILSEEEFKTISSATSEFAVKFIGNNKLAISPVQSDLIIRRKEVREIELNRVIVKDKESGWYGNVTITLNDASSSRVNKSSQYSTSSNIALVNPYSADNANLAEALSADFLLQYKEYEGGHKNQSNVVYTANDPDYGPIPNQLILALGNRKPEALVTDKKGAQFLIYFIASSDQNSSALATTSNIKNINIISRNPESFNVQPNAQSSSKIWSLIPQKSSILAPEDFAYFTIENIITDFAPSATWMYLYYRNVTGYNAGNLALLIQKTTPEPTIVDIKCDKEVYEYGENIIVDYDAYGAKKWRIKMESSGKSPRYYEVPAKKRTKPPLKSLQFEEIMELVPEINKESKIIYLSLEPLSNNQSQNSLKNKDPLKRTINSPEATLSIDKSLALHDSPVTLSWNIVYGKKWAIYRTQNGNKPTQYKELDSSKRQGSIKITPEISGYISYIYELWYYDYAQKDYVPHGKGVNIDCDSFEYMILGTFRGIFKVRYNLSMERFIDNGVAQYNASFDSRHLLIYANYASDGLSVNKYNIETQKKEHPSISLHDGPALTAFAPCPEYDNAYTYISQPRYDRATIMYIYKGGDKQKIDFRYPYTSLRGDLTARVYSSLRAGGTVIEGEKKYTRYLLITTAGIEAILVDMENFTRNSELLVEDTSSTITNLIYHPVTSDHPAEKIYWLSKWELKCYNFANKNISTLCTLTTDRADYCSIIAFGSRSKDIFFIDNAQNLYRYSFTNRTLYSLLRLSFQERGHMVGISIID